MAPPDSSAGHSATSAAASAPIPPVIPDHEVFRCIGRGSYGDVWLARSVTGAWRATKVVRRRADANDRAFDREFRGIQNYEPISRSAEHLMAILHVGRSVSDDFFYYVMELADDAHDAEGHGGEGEIETTERPPSATHPISGIARSIDSESYGPKTLRHEIQQRGSLPVTECIELGIALASALETLHGAGLVHRDVKPSNIIYVKGRAKLADIGLVAATDGTLSLVGTLGYAPAKGVNTPQADLYSLGKVLYEASTGKDRQFFPEPLTDVESSAETSAWAELNEVLLKACAEEPDKRYPSATALRNDLLRLQAGQSLLRARTAERRLRVLYRMIAALGGIAVLVLAGYFREQRQARRFAALANENRHNLVRLNVSNGIRSMDEGDLLGSLPWFVEALRLDEAEPRRAEMHRRRIEAILRQCPKLVALGAHEGPIQYSELSPNGTKVVTASFDQTARVWDANSGEPITAPLRHGGSVVHAVFFPDGERIITASADGMARVFNARTGEEMLKLKHAGAIECVAISPDGSKVATASADRTARIWDAKTGVPLEPALQHKDTVTCLAFDYDGSLLATGSGDGDGNLRVWNVATRELACPPCPHPARIRSVAFSPDGSLVAAGGSEATARIWDANTGKPVTPPLKHSGTVWHVEFSPDSQTLLTSGGFFFRTGEARLWNARTGEPVRDPFLHRSPVQCARFSPDGRWIATASVDQTVRIWERSTGFPVTSPLRHAESVWSVAFSSDGRRLLTSSKDGTWRVWDLVNDTYKNPMVVSGREIRTGEFDARGEKVITANDDGTVQLLDMTSSRRTVLVVPELDLPLHATISSDGQWIAAAVSRGGGLLWRTASSPVEYRLGGRSKQWYTMRVAFSPDGGRVAYAGFDGGEIVCELKNTNYRSIHLPHRLPVWFVSFSPDGKWLVTTSGPERVAGVAGEARIWNAKTGAPASSPIPHEGCVSHAAFSSDSRRLVTTDRTFPAQPGFARVWGVPEGTPTDLALRHNELVMHAVFSPDGRLIATASADRTARVWDATTGQPVGRPLQHRRGVQTIEFSPDSSRVVTASYDDTARVWDARTGEALTPPLKHDGRVLSAAFSPDGEKVLTVGRDFTARIWDAVTTSRSVKTLQTLALLLSGAQIGAAGALESASPPTLTNSFHRLHLIDETLVRASDAAATRWHEYHALRGAQTRDWPTELFHVEQLLASRPTDPGLAFRRERALVELWRESPGRFTNCTEEEVSRIYPARKPGMSSSLIDLTKFYNAPLFANWRSDIPDPEPLPIPRGCGTFAGVSFDVRGIVQLVGGHEEMRDGYDFPIACEGVPIGRRAGKIHFLHGDLKAYPNGTRVMVYRVHRRDGTTEEIAVRFGEQIERWCRMGRNSLTDASTAVGWQGKARDAGGVIRDVGVFRFTWTNPRPDVEIESLDARAILFFPFILAITVE